MNGRHHNWAGSDARYVQPRLAGLSDRVRAIDVLSDLDLRELMEAILAIDPEDAELALIALDRDQHGYLTVGHVAAMLNWIITRQPDPDPPCPPRCIACHRVLTDQVSQSRGYGPTCWEKFRRGRT